MWPAAGDSVVVPLRGLVVPDRVDTTIDALDDAPTGPVRIVVTDGIVTDLSAPTIDPETVAGRAMTGLIHADDEATLAALLTKRDGVIRSIRIGAPDGVQSQLELTTESDDGRRVVLTGWDVTSHARRQHVLEQLALHDSLTGLVNRAFFGERLHDELRRRRRTNENLAVLYADMDGFKKVNDTWGHRAGDLLLAALAARLRGCVRPGDVLARLGGDEFGVCCPDIADADAALAVAHRLVEEATAPVNLGGAMVRVSISVGVAMADDEDVTDYGGRLLARADLAMYAAKNGGKERVALAPYPAAAN